MADQKISKRDGSSDGSPTGEKNETLYEPGTHTRGLFEIDNAKQLNAVFENPLARVDSDELLREVELFCHKYGMMDHIEVIKKGALVARDPPNALEVEGLTPDERQALLNEHQKKWNHPWMLYWLTVMCSLGAATQGMDESVNNGAVSIYPTQLHFTGGPIYQGLVVGAPYLACAAIGCWLNEPMNRYFGRRGTIFISCVIAAAASIWEGFVNSWGNLFAARFVLGLGIGAKSSTMYVSEH